MYGGQGSGHFDDHIRHEAEATKDDNNNGY